MPPSQFRAPLSSSQSTSYLRTIDSEHLAHDQLILSPSALQCDDVAASIISEAERCVQAESFKSTSDVLMLASSVSRRDIFARASPIQRSSSYSLNSTSIDSYLVRDNAGGSVINILSDPSLYIETFLSLSPLFIETSLPSSPRCSPPCPPTDFDDGINLPGKFGALSSAEVRKESTSSTVNRTEFLSKLDGLHRVIPVQDLSWSSSILSDDSVVLSNGSMDSSDELIDKVATSSSVVSAAMENAHAHAKRIKLNLLKRQQWSRENSVENSVCYSSTPPDSTLCLSGLVTDQSVNGLRSPLDSIMPLWVKRKIDAEMGSGAQERITSIQLSGDHFSQYELHSSETIITHELNRNDWTWTAEWSPDGKYLALATENHGLAIVEVATTTPVWRVIHDERIGKVKNDSTHAIRSIAWGRTFIALGGTGDAVSIVEPRLISASSACGSKRYSFDKVDVITGTGFVGALSWLKSSNILAIGNRDDKCLIADIRHGEKSKVTSTILSTIERADWVTAVQFSHGGTKLAVGDRSGLLSVYFFVIIRPGEAPALSPVKDIALQESILVIQWSLDDKFLHVGGEDYSITILDTARYSIQHRIGRDRWVSFLAPSHGGSYLAAGGLSYKVSLLDVNAHWKEVTTLSVGGGVPLHAAWHPNDKFLAVCGQFNYVVVYESSCERLPEGKCLRSKSSIIAVQFSPNGNMIAVGNETGLVTFFDALTSTFVTLYETVIGTGGNMTIKWSPNGKFVAIASGSTFVLLDTLYSGKEGKHPQSQARFLVRKILHSGVVFSTISCNPMSQFLALSDSQTRILDLRHNCSCVRVLDQSNDIDQSHATSSAWSDDGSLFAMVGGRASVLSIYDMNSSFPDKWELIFSISLRSAISSLCWGSSVTDGLYYLAFGGGDGETITILEIRSNEQIWETVLEFPFCAKVNVLDWNNSGLLSIGDADGSVSVLDLSYLKSGQAVSEMSYNWQKQGLISTTKLTRNYGRNAITSLCWLLTNSLQTNGIHLAIGGSDGVVEIVDLSNHTNRFNPSQVR
jgi:WD40 repeat protein